MRQLVLRFYEQLWNHWDDSVVAEVLAPGFRFRGSLGQQTIDREGWRAYRDQIRRGAPDFHNDVVDLIISDDRAAARLSYTGTHSGLLVGIPATGRSFTYSGAAFFTAAEGLLVQAWVLGDIEGLRTQLS